MKLQNDASAEKKRLRLPKIKTRGQDPFTDLGIGLDGTMIMGL